MKKTVYTIERTTEKVFGCDGKNKTSYTVWKNGREIQSLHYCDINRLLDFLKAVDADEQGA